jgi:cytochrome oxidase assembly protein ShyY1
MDLFVRQHLLVGIRRLTRCGVCKLFGWPALVTLVGLVVLSSLGTWQIYRLHWKRDLINLIETRLSRPPQKIETIQVRDLFRNLSFRRLKRKAFFWPIKRLNCKAEPMRDGLAIT